MFVPPAHRMPRPDTRAAFTLVEVLVSMTVLILLALAVSQMVRGATTIATSDRQHLDADGQARLVFDRMGMDLGRMLKRQDVSYIFKDSSISPQVYNDSSAAPSGDDRFFFYTEAPAFFYNDPNGSAAPASAQSPLALVGYRINGGAQPYPYQLSRLGKGLNWDESNRAAQGATEPVSIAFLTPASTPSINATPAPDPATTLAGRWQKTLGSAPDYVSDPRDLGAIASYHVIADQVCRMEMCFLLKPRPASTTATGQFIAAQPARYSVDPYYKIDKVDGTGVADPAHSAVNGLQDVRAIVVALAVLDRASRQNVPDLGRMSATKALRDITASDLAKSPPVLMAKIWQDVIDQGKLATGVGIPAAAAAQVRVYQRHFYLDTN